MKPQVVHFVALWTSAPWQLRVDAQADPRLLAAAQWKAQDIADTGVVPRSHQDSGLRWPNQLVRDFDYTLPDWDSYKPDRNAVESLAWGFLTAEDALAGLYESDNHRPHLTGEGHYGDQVMYGVGYAALTPLDKDRIPGVYVLVTCPPEPVDEVTIPVEPSTAVRLLLPLVRR